MTTRDIECGRRSRATRWGVAFLLASIPWVVIAPAAHASCAITDLQCVTNDVNQTVTTTVNDTVGDAGGAVGDTVDKANDTLNDVVDTAKKTVDDTVGKVQDTVDDTVGRVPDPTGGGGGTDPIGTGPGDDGPGGGRTGPGSGRDGGKNGATGPSGGGAAPSLVPTVTSPRVSMTGTGMEPVAPSTPEQRPGLAGRIARVAAAAAKGLGFPLALALIVVGFLLAQDRVDRRDPKLALAPIRPEVATFE